MTSHCRKTYLSVVALLSVLALAFAASAAAQVTPLDPTTNFTKTFEYTGGEQSLSVPEGVRGTLITAIGGRGASKGTKAGGFAARVTGLVHIGEPGLLYVFVGGNGSGENGGFNGGGYGGSPAHTGAAVGGGGGGASDVRLMPSYFGQESLLSRLIVAAGGGGASALANSQPKLNAAGGSAGKEGARAESAGAGNTKGSGGYGGKAGTQGAGGSGGEGGFPYATGTGERGENGHAGSLGAGGEGGHGPNNAPPGWGGGGGGGLYGGGGGGGGSTYTGGEQPVNTAGGGGGGGSSLAPLGGTVTLEEESNAQPLVTISWTIPGTTMEVPVEYGTEEPAYKLTSEDADSYECRLATEPSSEWESCEAEGKVPTTGSGKFRFEARSVNIEGNFDPTPAALEFWVVKEPPVVSMLNGPAATTETQPTFTFAATSIVPVHYECAFDGAAPGPCSGELSDRPATPLAVGPHTFTVTPIDAAGNVGAAATKAFMVEAPPVTKPIVPPPTKPTPPAPQAKVSGQPKIDATTGTATVVLAVNGGGTVKVSGSGVKTVTISLGSSGNVHVPIKPNAKTKKKLKKTGKAKVKVTITYTTADGSSATVTKTVTLRQKKKHKGGGRRS
jgi:hypothetical protein